MAKSILQGEKECFFCKSQVWLEDHHIFGGANRSRSEKYGLKVWLCHYCHNEPPRGVHHNRANMDKLRAIGQRAFMEHYPDKDFVFEFGRNFL